ncbi:MAG: hypothetical protein PHC64_07170 [Candidatus Gastranaerophilales bacterium]|nr:hypothetical protein [Candidatus Gastranaerophilales bacterium]
MKINSIGFFVSGQKSQNYNLLNSENSSSQNNKFIRKHPDILNQLLVNYIPHVSFTAKKFTPLSIKDLPCPCCGKLMIPMDVVNKELTEQVLSGTSRIAVRALKQFEKYMHGVEKTCFARIEEASRKSPRKSLQEILQGLRQESLKTLEPHQMAILEQVDKTGEALSPASKRKLNSLTAEARKLIKESSSVTYDPMTIDDEAENLVIFRRKIFLHKIADWVENLPEQDKAVGAEIFKAAQKLKTAKDDPDALIVKYSGVVTRKVEGQYVTMLRTSYEIGQRLILPAVSTFEHVRPKSDGGSKELRNGLAECFGCNNARGGMPLEQWVKLHPEMEDNYQYYIDTIISLINSNTLHMRENLHHYPRLIAETLRSESNGRIKLNITGLKPLPEAKRAFPKAVLAEA